MVSDVDQTRITIDLGWRSVDVVLEELEYAIGIIYIGGIPLSHFGIKYALVFYYVIRLLVIFKF